MPWYVPLVSAVVGALIGFFGAYKVSAINFNRQIASDIKSLMIVIESEIGMLVSLLRKNLDQSVGDYYASFGGDFDTAALVQVYKANCGKFGLLDESVLDLVMRFYVRLLCMRPIKNTVPNTGSQFEKADLEACIQLGQSATTRISEKLKE